MPANTAVAKSAVANSAAAKVRDHLIPRNDVVATVEDHLKQLHAIALRKLKEDPLPFGYESEKRIRAEIRELGLDENVADLETKGFTVLPPGKAAPIEFTERLRDTVLQLAEAADENGISGNFVPYRAILHTLPRHPIFEEALLAPAPLALLTYLLGYRAKLCNSSSIIKGRTDEALRFHSDHGTKMPPPWTVAQHAPVTWVLSDYTRDNGALCVVPGSHRRGMAVPASLEMAHDHEEVEVIEAPAGSVIVFHGSLWHGAMPRKNDGHRITLVLLCSRDHIQTQEAYWVSTTPEMLERNPRRFATLMGLTSQYPWISAIDPAVMASGPPREWSQFD